MKTPLRTATKSVIRVTSVMIMFIAVMILSGKTGQAQIYEPEGLNMPGAWNTWINPPANNLVLASSTQVTGGKVVKIATGTPRWQTTIAVAATGGDLTAGTYEWLFTSGSTSNYYQNKWAAVTVTMNTLQLYTKEGATNNSITMANGKWYTMNYEDLGYADTRAIFMETSGVPVSISTVSVPSGVLPAAAAPVTVTVSAAPSMEEIIYVRYTVDGWVTSVAIPVTMIGTTGTVNIPGQVVGTVVSYYAFTSTVAAAAADYDLVTIKLNNNSGTNYTYTVGVAPPAITFANLQYPDQGSIDILTDFWVFGQAYIAGVTGLPTPAPGLQSWVGYSTTNSNPATWTDWVPATYNAPMGNNDEYKANIGPAINNYGRFYYATRFKLNADPYLYGGFSVTGGGFWDGVTNVSGILDVYTGIPEGQGIATTVYPNPTSGALTFDLPFHATLRFTSALGIELLQTEIQPGIQHLDISAFKPGAYHLQVITGKQTMHQTIIKR
ncbi:MAG: T9SS type A sorting domain-containing protein [Bacteroidetes bacterium]|nr:T9SS type A sorting domain-containing protein [Bacteroidota bacterium]